MVKKLPVGIEEFKEIRTQGFYYVDKTELIKELLENWGKVNLFTRPRRFGKSLTMDMLKTFFEIGCDKGLFDGLNYQAACNALRFIIGNEAHRFEFLRESDRLSEADKESYGQLTKVSDGSKGKAVYDISDASLLTSLTALHFAVITGCLRISKESISISIRDTKYDEDGNLERGCADTLNQVGGRKYAVDFERQKMKKIIKYGIAFHKKDCMVVKA